MKATAPARSASIALVVMFVLSVFAVPTVAAEGRADYMADMCREITRSSSFSRTYEDGFCLGQFSVVERLIGSGRSISDPPYPAFSKVCFTPADLIGNRNRIETLIVTFVRYVDALPRNRRQEGFLNIAIESLERAFPCTESRLKQRRP